MKTASSLADATRYDMFTYRHKSKAKLSPFESCCRLASVPVWVAQDTALADVVSETLEKVPPIVQQGNMLAKAHALRTIEASSVRRTCALNMLACRSAVPPPHKTQPLFFHCTQAVSNPIAGAHALRHDTDPEPAITNDLHSRQMTPGFHKANRLIQVRLHCCSWDCLKRHC